jgi:MscS family membrane protein
MFEYEIWGNSVQNWIISILIIVAAIVIVKLITLLSRRVLKPLTDRTKNQLDNIIFYSLRLSSLQLFCWVSG